MLPAQQRLEAADPIALEIEDRLEVEPELATLDRFAQVELERTPLARCGIERGLEEAEYPAPVLLGTIQREVGILEQRVAVGAVVRADRDADAGPGSDLMPIDEQRAAHLIEDRLRQSARAIDIVMIGEDDRELVAAKPRDDCIAGDTREDVAHLAEQSVADRVAERIVDPLEPVEIEAQQGRALSAFERTLQFGLELLAEIGAVWQAGQRVVEREMRDAMLPLDDPRRHPVEALREPPDLVVALDQQFGARAFLERARGRIERCDRTGDPVRQAAAAEQDEQQPHHTGERDTDLHRAIRRHRRCPRIAQQQDRARLARRPEQRLGERQRVAIGQGQKRRLAAPADCGRDECVERPRPGNVARYAVPRPLCIACQDRRGERDSGQMLQRRHLGAIERKREHHPTDFIRGENRCDDEPECASSRGDDRLGPAAREGGRHARDRTPHVARASTENLPLKIYEECLRHVGAGAQRREGRLDRRPIAARDRRAEAEIARQHRRAVHKRVRAHRPNTIVDAAAGPQFGADRVAGLAPDHELPDDCDNEQAGCEQHAILHREPRAQMPEAPPRQGPYGHLSAREWCRWWCTRSQSPWPIEPAYCRARGLMDATRGS